MNVARIFLGIVAGLFGWVLLLPVVLLAMPLLLVPALTRLVVRVFQPASLPWEEWIQFDPQVGWRPKPNRGAYHRADGVFRTTTDADGWRGKTSIEDAEVVVFGDSFAWGYAANDDEFFADLDPHRKIKSIGINGYSMVQCLLWMEKLAPRLQGKLVVWFVYVGNDFCDNLSTDMRGYRAPFVRERKGGAGWEIVTSHLSRERWPLTPSSRRAGWHYLQKTAEICCENHFSRRAFSACEHLVHAARSVCERAGARLVVLSIPDLAQMSSDGLDRLRSLCGNHKTFDADRPDRELARICRANGVPFVATKPLMSREHFKAYDCHWNRDGNQRIAEIIAELHDGTAGEGAELEATLRARDLSIV